MWKSRKKKRLKIRSSKTRNRQQASSPGDENKKEGVTNHNDIYSELGKYIYFFFRLTHRTTTLYKRVDNDGE